ncbi:hypothetical protein C0J52_16446, partial [Blattella germanica]
HLRGYNNSHNNCHWSTQNPNLIHQVPLHDLKIGVWCTMRAKRVIESIFFNEAVNFERCMTNILTPFIQNLTGNEKVYGYFQQYGAPAHTERCEVCVENQGGHFQHLL